MIKLPLVKSRLERYFVISIWDDLWWPFLRRKPPYYGVDFGVSGMGHFWRKFRTRKRQFFELIPILRCRKSGRKCRFSVLNQNGASKSPVLKRVWVSKSGHFGVVSAFFEIDLSLSWLGVFLTLKIADSARDKKCRHLTFWSQWIANPHAMVPI